MTEILNEKPKLELYHGDCLEIMPLIKDKSIDMILADLPYGTTSCSWDTIIPFESLWKEYKRIIKDNGAIVLTASQPFTSALVMSNPDNFKHSWIWDKGLSGNIMLAEYQPMKIHEDILVFSYGKVNYFPIKIEGEVRQMRNNGMNDSAFGNMDIYIGEFSDKRNPKTILYFPNTDRKNIIHPTQKPVTLFEYLIKTYTNEGDLVLDNVAGSGTTGIAAMNLKRNCILIEKESKYCDIIRERVKNECRKQTLL